MSRGRRPRRAHPRSRGENAVLWVAMRADGGSSPLTRGKRGFVGGHAGGRGLIPAHAGKTTGACHSSRWPRAHPRSRGENRNASVQSTRTRGSSPLTRGKRRWPDRFGVFVGLIPAHAEKTGRAACPLRVRRAHPRSRGENPRRRPQVDEHWGSSPLTRGKRESSTATHTTARLIPAHAGKTSRGWRGRPSERAHPRSRGENIVQSLPALKNVGSSPLTRGKPQLEDPASPSVRLIPAHAGKTAAALPLICSMAAHPRSRGENRVDDRDGG